MGRARSTRRAFLQKASLAAASMALGVVNAMPQDRPLGANERIALGIAGPGSRGRSLMAWANKFAKTENCEFVAVADLLKDRRERAAKIVQDWTGKKPIICRNLEELCQLKEVDAVIIATADFQHAPHCRMAVEMGKDVYVEKPLGCDFEQVKLCWQAVKRTKRVVQVGTQAGSSGGLWGTQQFIKSGGLGKVTYVEVAQPLFQQRWRIRGSETAITEKDVDWRRWLCYLPYIPFNPRYYLEFRLFWPFSSGCLCQWASHAMNEVNVCLDSIPKYAMCWGGVYLWQDGRTNPDTIDALWEYPEGILCRYHMRLGNSANGRGITIYGTRGTVTPGGKAVPDGGGGEVICENPEDPNPSFRVDKSKLIPKEGIDYPKPPSVDHMQHWLQCLRTREQPRSNIDWGYAHAVATILANMSYRNGCRMEYDHEKMEMKKSPIT